MIGSGGIIVMDDREPPLFQAERLSAFFCHSEINPAF
jgi:NADH:ubiquinone oxidoreductase subunit F (NADH-binding)